MRLALSSSAFDSALGAGDLTQLELLDHCAGIDGLDAIVLDVAHFPRRDDEYLAQLKKFAADLGLTLAAVRDDALTSAERDLALQLSAALGAPYVLTRMPEGGIDPVSVYNATLSSLAKALAEAKRLNVTLAVRNVPGSLAADAFELARLRKEADSAWLRFALDVAAFGEGSLDEKIRKRVVLAYHDASRGGAERYAGIGAALRGFPGFLCLDYHGAGDEGTAVARIVCDWANELARERLDVAEPRVPS